jgi:hypothetical protein
MDRHVHRQHGSAQAIADEEATKIFRNGYLAKRPKDDPEKLPYIAGLAVVFLRPILDARGGEKRARSALRQTTARSDSHSWLAENLKQLDPTGYPVCPEGQNAAERLGRKDNASFNGAVLLEPIIVPP